MKKTRLTFNLFSISQARNVLFGLATLWIGLFHSDNLTLSVLTDNQELIESFKFFRGSGNIGVDMFLFLSGVGLFFSFSKDSNVLSFWKKRLMRVLPSAFLIATFYFSLRYVNGRNTSGLLHYISRISFTYFFVKGERVFWFISLILVLYIVFPIFYKIIERFRLWGMLGLVVLTVAITFLIRWRMPGFYGYWEIALCRVPAFVIGIWAGKFVKEKKEISLKWMWLFFALAAGFLTLIYFYTPIMESLVQGYNKDMETRYIFWYRYAGTIIGISLVILLSFICVSMRSVGKGNLLRNFFEFVGMYSMEYYMIYLNINHYLERVYDISLKHEYMLYFGSFVVTLVLCVMVRKVCDFFMAYMQRKPKKAVAFAGGASAKEAAISAQTKESSAVQQNEAELPVDPSQNPDAVKHSKTSLLFGVLSIVFSGIFGIVFGVIAKGNAECYAQNYRLTGRVKVGKVLGLIGMIKNIVGVSLLVILLLLGAR